MKIETATPEDSDLIADAIIAAIGEDLADSLAGENHSRADVHDLFRRLAARTDTQYSYLNTRIARSDAGDPMGVCVSYDGALLKSLRRSFFQEAAGAIGWVLSPEEIEDFPEETEAGEFYLDSLMTLPEYRGRGVARALISDASLKAKASGKPLGLLCDKENDRARRLYESVGFVEVGKRPFAGHMMDHMQIPL